MDDIIRKYIDVNPEIHHGKPFFRGTRVPVYAALELLAGGKSVKEIAGQNYYPALNADHVRAALHFVAGFGENQEFTLFKNPL